MTTDPSKSKGPRTQLGGRLAYYRDYADAGSIGLQFILCMAAGFLVGRWVDARWFESRGTATMVGAVFGVLAGFRSLWQTAAKMKRKLDDEAAAREKMLLGDRPSGKPAGKGSDSAD